VVLTGMSSTFWFRSIYIKVCMVLSACGIGSRVKVVSSSWFSPWLTSLGVSVGSGLGLTSFPFRTMVMVNPLSCSLVPLGIGV
jgi:hypothetical protein